MKVPYAAILGAVVNGQKERITREEAAACLAVIEHLRDSLSKAESKIVQHLGALVSPDANMAEQIARYLDGRARKELDGSMERMQVSRAAEWLRHLRTAPEARELETARADCEQQHREYLEERQEHQATLALAAKEREYAGELHTAALVAATTLEYAKCPVAARTLRAVLEKAPNNARHVAGVDGSPARADSVLTPAVGSEPHGEGCGSNPPAAHQTALTVPREPTEAMLDAGREAMFVDLKRKDGMHMARAGYRAMVAAAPSIQPQMNSIEGDDDCPASPNGKHSTRYYALPPFGECEHCRSCSYRSDNHGERP